MSASRTDSFGRGRRAFGGVPPFLRKVLLPLPNISTPPPPAHQPLEVTFLTSRLSWGRTARSGVSSSRPRATRAVHSRMPRYLSSCFTFLTLWRGQDRHVGYFKRQRLIHCYPFFMRICPGMGTSEYVASRQKESLPIGKEGLSRNGGPDLLTPAPLSLSVTDRNASSTGAYKRIHPAGL